MRHLRTPSRRTPPPSPPKSRNRAKRKHSTVRTLPWLQILLLPLFAALLGGLVYLWFSGILRVSYIEVAGNTTLTGNELVQTLSGYQGRNIFLVNRQNVRDDLLQAFPPLATVDVTKRYFPNRLSIEVREKSPYVIWHTGSEAYQVDESGLIIGRADLTQNNLPLIYAFGASPRLAEARAAAAAQAAEGNPDGGPGENITESPVTPDSALIDEATADVTAQTETLPSLLKAGDKVAERAYLQVVHALVEEIPEIIGDREIAYVESGEYDDLTVLLTDGLEIRIKTSHTVNSSLERLETTLEEAQRVGKPLALYVDLRFEKVYGK